MTADLAARDLPYMKFQEPECACLNCDRLGPCSESAWQSTGPCLVLDCTHYGTEVDGGLCEGCYVATK